jgi:hypothetical protein
LRTLLLLGPLAPPVPLSSLWAPVVPPPSCAFA